jgi:hypothetical protein
VGRIVSIAALASSKSKWTCSGPDKYCLLASATAVSRLVVCSPKSLPDQVENRMSRNFHLYDPIAATNVTPFAAKPGQNVKQDCE